MMLEALLSFEVFEFLVVFECDDVLIFVVDHGTDVAP